MPTLILPLTQEEIKTPYTFTAGGTKAYSLEEAMYYTFTHWKEADFLRESFLLWIENTLHLHNIAAKLGEVKTRDTYSEKLLGFLSITPYLDPLKLVTLKSEVALWEKTSQGHLLKQEGDMLLATNPLEATQLYQKALSYGEEATIYNNMGISFMHQGAYDKALDHFEKAYVLNNRNPDIMINYAKALIETKEVRDALNILEKLEVYGENSHAHFLRGKLSLEEKNIPKAIEHLQKAIAISPNSEYYYQLANVYIEARRYGEAIDIIEEVKDRDKTFYINLSNIYALSGDYPKAITAMEMAITMGENNAETYAALASYHRLNYDLDKARLTITTALKIDNTNKLVRLEEAKIKKSQGHLRDYQKIMDNILSEAKETYRTKHIRRT